MLFTQSSFKFETTHYTFDFNRSEVLITGINRDKNITAEFKGNVSTDFLEIIKGLIIKTSFGLIHSENINKLGKIKIDAASLGHMIELEKNGNLSQDILSYSPE